MSLGSDFLTRNNYTLKDILLKLKDYWVQLLSFFGFFIAFAYFEIWIYCLGYFSKLGISSTYIDLSNKAKLYNVILLVCVTMIILFIAFILRAVSHGSRLIIIRNWVFIFSILYVLNGIISFFLLITSPSRPSNAGTYLPLILMLSAIFLILESVLIIGFLFMIRTIFSDNLTNDRIENKIQAALSSIVTIKRMLISVFIIGIVISIFSILNLLFAYFSPINITNSPFYIDDSNNFYWISGVYQSNFIVKPCTLENNKKTTNLTIYKNYTKTIPIGNTAITSFSFDTISLSDKTICQVISRMTFNPSASEKQNVDVVTGIESSNYIIQPAIYVNNKGIVSLTIDTKIKSEVSNQNNSAKFVQINIVLYK